MLEMTFTIFYFSWMGSFFFMHTHFHFSKLAVTVFWFCKNVFKLSLPSIYFSSHWMWKEFTSVHYKLSAKRNCYCKDLITFQSVFVSWSIHLKIPMHNLYLNFYNNYCFLAFVFGKEMFCNPKRRQTVFSSWATAQLFAALFLYSFFFAVVERFWGTIWPLNLSGLQS